MDPSGRIRVCFRNDTDTDADADDADVLNGKRFFYVQFEKCRNLNWISKKPKLATVVVVVVVVSAVIVVVKNSKIGRNPQGQFLRTEVRISQESEISDN